MVKKYGPEMGALYYDQSYDWEKTLKRSRVSSDDMQQVAEVHDDIAAEVKKFTSRIIAESGEPDESPKPSPSSSSAAPPVAKKFE